MNTYTDAALRSAISTAITESANNTPVTIDFTNGPGTILLTGGVLEFNEESGAGLITLNGNNQNITINAQGESEDFAFSGGSQVAMESLTITGGASADGGAIYNGGTLTVSNSTLSGSSALDNGDDYEASGGAIYNDGTLTVSDSTFSGNSASDYGGAIVSGGTLTVSGSTFSGNTASYGNGGAIDNNGILTVSNSTFSGNIATNGGGGAICTSYVGSTLTLLDSTVSANSAGGFGGGIEIFQSTATITNSIIAGNTSVYNGPDIDGAVVDSSSYNLIGNGTGMTGISNASAGNQVGAGSSPINPLLAPLGNYGGPTQTMPLLPGSPAIDAGSNSLSVDANGNPLTTDQRGQPRIVNTTVDSGAFESQGFSLGIASGNNQSVAGNAAFNPVVVNVTANNTLEPVNGGQVAFTVTPGASGASEPPQRV